MRRWNALLATVLLVLGICLGMTWQGPARAEAFDDKPVNFVVLDGSRSVTPPIYRSWYQMVKMNYHFPYHKISDDNSKALPIVEAMLQHRVDREAMAKAAEEAGCDVLVVVWVRRMEEEMIQGGWWGNPWNHDTYVRTYAYADMYAYNKDGNKFTSKMLRKSDVTDLGNQEHPEITIKWALGNMLNAMEGRPQI